MLLAAAFAGIGFGNAGVRLPHGMSYPVSDPVRDYIPTGYPADPQLSGTPRAYASGEHRPSEPTNAARRRGSLSHRAYPSAASW